jgi:hypothetical protein
MTTRVLHRSAAFLLPIVVLLAGCTLADDGLDAADVESNGDALVDGVTSTGGVWISKSELLSLPTSGAAWDRVRSDANKLSGSADLADNNSNHDVMTLAAAYVATRTGDAAMRIKAIRNIQAYVVAADVIGPIFA